MKIKWREYGLVWMQMRLMAWVRATAKPTSRRGELAAGFEYPYPKREREEETSKGGLSPAGSEPGHGFTSADPGAHTQVGWSRC
jgi:hypothetical protein